MTSAGGTKAELKYSDMNSALLLSRFPELSGRINSELEINGELPYVLFENVLNPVLREYFGAHDYSGAKTRREQKSALKNAYPLIVRVFDFFEELAASDDEEVRDLLRVGLLEALYDSSAAYNGARLFMGAKTRSHFEEIAYYINNP